MSSKENACLLPEELDSLAMGELPAAEVARLILHLDHCLSCQTRMEEIVGTGSWVPGSTWRLKGTTQPADQVLSDLMLQLKSSGEVVDILSSKHAAYAATFAYFRPSKVPNVLGYLGDYEVLEELGRGGMGVVFKARDPRLKRMVAIKVMSVSLAEDRDARTRFLREAQSIAALNHDHVVTIHAVDQQQGVPFLVMEYIQGATLAEHIRAHGPLPAQEIVLVGSQITAALEAAHAQGIVHRDIKPNNIFLQKNPTRVKVGDFGLVHLMDEIPITQVGVVAGTPQYLSPEQAQGEQVDHRSDLFSLGCLLYAMGTGHSPFPATSILQAVRSVCEQTPPSLRSRNASLPNWLCSLIEKLLAKDPRDRYQTAQALGQALQQGPDDEMATTRVPKHQKGAHRDLAHPTAHPTAQLTAHPTRSESHRQRSIAVLPFKNISADEDNEYFGEGLAEELLDALAKLKGLVVASRCSAFQFKGQSLDVRDVGRHLNVAVVLEGSVRKAGAQLRIAVQLVDAQTGFQLWSQRYDRDLSDLFVVQEEIAHAIASELDLRLQVGASTQALVTPTTENIEAYTEYLRGRYHWNHRRPNGLGKALDCYNKALSHDPNYPLALAGKADCLLILGMYAMDDQRFALPAARAAAEGALATDQDLAEAHSSMGFTLAVSDYRWQEAQRHFLRSFELDPNLAHSHMAYAYSVLLATNRLEDAMREAELAARLDPVTPMVAAGTAIVCTHMRQYTQAIVTFESVLELHPDCPTVRLWKSLAHLWSGQYDAAWAELEHASPFTLLVAETRAILFALQCQHDEVRQSMKQFQADIDENARAILSLARVYAVLEQTDLAFAWLEKAFQERVVGLVLLNVDPCYDSLREDPRFDQLLSRMQLVQ
jgi:serine/threonine protein kinase/Tfp pilus assembly protein PilF